ncbi:MAG: transporter substrate-binding domain-containing protein, partial [Campylobacteraceae bacterium]|nr:transporter substrate-binding domain-containing protein [Campylobacteraceae bacterium]
MNLSWTQQRENDHFDYTKAYNYKPSYLIVRDTNTNIHDLSDLNNKAIYLKEKSIDYKTVEDASLNTKIVPMKNDEMMYQNLSTKVEVDAFISYSMDKEKLKQYDLKVAKTIYNKYGEVYLGVNHKYKPLHSIINKIYKVIPKNELSTLRNTVYESKNKIGIDLAEDEEYWLKNNPTIKIAVMNYWKLDDQGNSIHTDILKLLNKYGGINLIPIKFNAWKDGYNEAISGKLIQGIMNLSWTKEREDKYFHYTTAYNYKPAYLVIRNNYRKIQSIQDLDKKTIFLKEKSVVYNTISDASIDTKIIAMKTDEMMYKGLSSNKEVDAFISSTINKEKLNQYNLKIIQTIHEKYGEVSLGLNHKYPQLQSIIDKIYQIIPKSELLNLRNKVYKSTQTVDLKLSPEEKKWIETNTVTIGVEQWAPILFSNDGSDIDGIAGDFTKKIIERSGLKFKIVTGTWDKLLEDFKNKKIDILPATYFTEKRSQYGLYSFDYFKMKDSLYVKESRENISSMKDLNGLTLAIVKDSGTIDKITSNFPNIKIIRTKSLNESIQKVLDGSVDALFEGKLAVEKKLNDELISGLKMIIQNNLEASYLHFFSKIDEPLLQSILQKGLQSITYSQRKKIISKWVNTDKELKLSEKEQNWLDKNIPIRYVYDPDWAPFEWKNELEKHSGILSDILNLISSKSGMELIPVPVNTWNEAVQKAKKREVDMYSGVGQTDEKLKYMKFTQKSIYQTPYVFVSRLDDT